MSTLEADLGEVREAITKNQKYGAKEAIARLGESTDDRALEMLLDAFEWALLRSCEPAKSALTTSPHPEVSVRIAERLPGWWEEKERAHSRLCVSHAGAVLAARGDVRALDAVRAIAEKAREASDNIVLRGMLFARVGMGDTAAQDEVREHFLTGPAHQGADAYPEKLLGVVSPAAYFDTFASIAAAYQDGDNTMAKKAGTVLFRVTQPQTKYEGTVRVQLPMPERDPRWFELGARMVAERPRPSIHSYAFALLDVPHPDAEARRAELGVEAPRPDPRLAKLPDTLKARHEEGAFAFWPAAYGTRWIHCPGLKLGELQELLDALGDDAADVRGLSLAGRPLNKAAFTKVFGWEGLRHFTHLSLASMRNLVLSEVRKLAKSPHLEQLEHLDLRAPAAKDPYSVIAKAKNLPALRSLRLGGTDSHQPGDDALRKLLAGSLRLRALELGHFKLQAATVELARSELGVGLEELTFVGQYRRASDISAFLEALAEGGGTLRRLVLERCFGNMSPQSWGAAPATLRELVVTNAGSAFFAPFAESPLLPQLERLSLASSYLDATALAPLLEANAPELRHLSLRHCAGVDRALLEALVQSPLVARVETLDVGGRTDLRADAIDAAPPRLAEAMRAAGWPR